MARGFDVVGFTASYESWLGERIPLVEPDLRAKHAQLKASVLRFLRGTYYLWLWRVADLLPELLDLAAVPLVGDLHIENFGTWRDRAGRRRWGVNDLDELASGSYALDLVRLATSAALTPDVALPARRLCRVLLDQWQTAAPGPAVDIDAASAAHLRALVPVPVRGYFAALRKDPLARPQALPDPVRTATVDTVSGQWQPTWHSRQAGTGSLGHPRLVALGRDEAGEWQAREAKLLGPSTVDWLRTVDSTPPWPVVEPALYDEVTAALHGSYPASRVDGWQIRRLAPDVVRISLAGLAARDAERVLRSMAQALADVHGTRPEALAAARADNSTRDAGWLAEAVHVMRADTRACHKRWCERGPD